LDPRVGKTAAGVPAGPAARAGAAIRTPRAPADVVAPTVISAVACVPSASTEIFATATLGSAALSLRKTTAIAPRSPRPVMVSTIVSPGAATAGVTSSTTGSISTDTAALIPGVIPRGPSARTL